MISYFAYGSNLDRLQFQQRCPGTLFEATYVAFLPDFELAFPRYSLKRRSGVAGLRAAPGGVVWGVVYSLHEEDLVRLDECEGYVEGRPSYLNQYQRQRMNVFHRDDPQSLTALEVFVYMANPFCEELHGPIHHEPTQGYLDHLWRGADDWNLPAGYIDFLRAIKVKGG